MAVTPTGKGRCKKDTGYAWIILFCMFLTRVIDSIMVVTMGIWMIEFLEYFHLDRAIFVTMLVSCYFVAMAIAGPIGGVAMNRFGVRPVMVGGVFSAVASFLIAGSFPKIWILAICFCLMGFGLQLSMQGTFVTVQLFFDKRRSFASGVMMAGVGAGTFIWPPILRLLIDIYTWRGAFYIAAGFVSQIFIFVSLMRPAPEDNTNGQDAKDDRKMKKETLPSKTEKLKKRQLSKKQKMAQEDLVDDCNNKQNIHEDFENKSKQEKIDHENLLNPATKEQSHHKDTEEQSETEKILIKDSLNTSKKEKDLCEDLSQIRLRNLGKRKPGKTLQYVTWGLYLVSLVLECMGHFSPLNYYPMKGRQEGIEKRKVPMLLSILGAMAIVCRPLAGYFGDRFVNRLTLATGANVVCGVILICSSCIRSFAPFFAASLFLGVSQSFYMGTLSAQWVDIFGLENISIASGLGSFCMGLSYIILQPIAGGLIDFTGDTDALFYFFGSFQILSGVLLLIVKLLLRHQKKKPTCTLQESAIAVSLASIATI